MYDFCDNILVHFQETLSELPDGRYRVSGADFTQHTVLITITRRTITDAIKWLHQVQKPEGGWVGSWGICFTYATQFALESLALGGEYYANSSAVRRACDFLLSKQQEDGGWGESYKVSCPLFLVFDRWADS